MIGPPAHIPPIIFHGFSTPIRIGSQGHRTTKDYQIHGECLRYTVEQVREISVIGPCKGFDGGVWEKRAVMTGLWAVHITGFNVYIGIAICVRLHNLQQIRMIVSVIQDLFVIDLQGVIIPGRVLQSG